MEQDKDIIDKMIQDLNNEATEAARGAYTNYSEEEVYSTGIYSLEQEYERSRDKIHEIEKRINVLERVKDGNMTSIKNKCEACEIETPERLKEGKCETCYNESQKEQIRLIAVEELECQNCGSDHELREVTFETFFEYELKTRQEYYCKSCSLDEWGQ